MRAQINEHFDAQRHLDECFHEPYHFHYEALPLNESDKPRAVLRADPNCSINNIKLKYVPDHPWLGTSVNHMDPSSIIAPIPTSRKFIKCLYGKARQYSKKYGKNRSANIRTHISATIMKSNFGAY